RISTGWRIWGSVGSPRCWHSATACWRCSPTAISRRSGYCRCCSAGWRRAEKNPRQGGGGSDSVARVEQGRATLLFGGREQQVELGQHVGDVVQHVLYHFLVLGVLCELALGLEQAAADPNRQQPLADGFLVLTEPVLLAQEYPCQKAHAPAAQIRQVRLVTQGEFARRFQILVAGQGPGDLRLELAQGGLDIGLLGLVNVAGLLGEQLEHPFLARKSTRLN